MRDSMFHTCMFVKKGFSVCSACCHVSMVNNVYRSLCSAPPLDGKGQNIAAKRMFTTDCFHVVFTHTES